MIHALEQQSVDARHAGSGDPPNEAQTGQRFLSQAIAVKAWHKRGSNLGTCQRGTTTRRERTGKMASALDVNGATGGLRRVRSLRAVDRSAAVDLEVPKKSGG